MNKREPPRQLKKYVPTVPPPKSKSKPKIGVSDEDVLSEKDPKKRAQSQTKETEDHQAGFATMKGDS